LAFTRRVTHRDTHKVAQKFDTHRARESHTRGVPSCTELHTHRVTAETHTELHTHRVTAELHTDSHTQRCTHSHGRVTHRRAHLHTELHFHP
jgi:hypothetical protein